MYKGLTRKRFSHWFRYKRIILNLKVSKPNAHEREIVASEDCTESECAVEVCQTAGTL